MPSKKLTTVAIPTLAAGEWYDQASPGLILRVGKQAPHLAVPLSRRRLLSPQAARAFPGDGAGRGP